MAVSKKRIETRALRELVARLEREAPREAPSRTTVAGTVGRSHRRLAAAKEADALVRWIGLGAALTALVVIGAWVSVSLDEWNGRRGPYVSVDEDVRIVCVAGPRPARGQVRTERAERQCEALIRELDAMRRFDRRALEDLIARARALVAEGRRHWERQGDGWQLLGRLHVYWCYTDRFDRIPASVKKDHLALARRAFARARACYARDGARSALRFRVHDWMPERRDAARFLERGSGRPLREVRTRSAERALALLEAFARGARRSLERV